MAAFGTVSEVIQTSVIGFLDCAPDGCLITSLDGKILYSNLAADLLFNAGPVLLISHKIFDFIAEPACSSMKNQLEQLAIALQEASQSHCPPSYQTRWKFNLVTRGQISIQVSASLNVAYTAPFEPAGLLWVVREHSPRWHTDVVLQENARVLESQKNFISSILESIPSSLLLIDRNLRIVAVNHNFLEKNRREEPAVIGHRLEEIFPPVLLDYTHMPQKVLETFRTGQALEGEKVAYRAAGLPTRTYYYRLIPLHQTPRLDGGKSGQPEPVESVMLLMDDVTEREQLGTDVRRAERHLAGVVECANDLVVSLDVKRHIVTWNRAAETASGYRSDEVQGHSLVLLCAPDQQPLMTKTLDELTHSASVSHAEVVLQTAKGRQIPIAWSFSPMQDDSGHMAGIVAVGRDLTEQRQMEEQLIHSTKMASLGVMAGGIAHEMRNPLGIISACAQLVMENPEDEELREQGLQKIHTATQRASLIIESLLKFSRSEADHSRKEVDLHAVLEEILELLAHQVALQKVTLKRQYAKDLPTVFGSSELVQQVFTNLVLNACNSMPEGGTLTISTEALPDKRVEIRFSDSGRGIAPENLSKIFDPFFTTMPAGQGVGLGLSICHSIVKQHQGTITVQSELRHGSTFIVRLPRNPQA
jgi:PAS domain S-box-containing protein